MIQKLREQMNQYFVGKEKVVDDLLICLFAGGHVLLEDIPGVGKTTLAKVLAHSTDCDFGRIQFTPDTLPGDVTGMSVYNMKTNEFEFRQGAIMHQIVLADEINRTSPKTQSSLLEAMSEGCITVDSTTQPLPKPFFVIATQNPSGSTGTYPLPEAQLDRFFMKLSIGYPEEAAELRMARQFLDGMRAEQATAVCSSAEITKAQETVAKITVSDACLQYIRNILDLTRQEKRFILGASPRAFLFLVRAAQAKAFMEARDFVKPDDVKAVAVNVLHHRLQLTAEAKINKENIDKIIEHSLTKAKVPKGEAH